MFNWPIVLDPLQKLDRVIAPRRGVYQPSLKSKLWMIALAVSCLIGGVIIEQLEEEQKDSPATIEFQNGPLNGFDI